MERCKGKYKKTSRKGPGKWNENGEFVRGRESKCLSVSISGEKVWDSSDDGLFVSV